MRKKLILNVGKKMEVSPVTMVDSAVQVRFGYLTREEGLSSEKIDEQLVATAYEESEASSLNDLIKHLAKEFAYKVAKLDLADFLLKFKANNLAEVIVGSFVRSISEMDNDPQKISKFGKLTREIREDEMNSAKDYVLQTIWSILEDKNLSGAVTLYELLKNLQSRFPYVRLGEVFTSSFNEEFDGFVKKTNLAEKLVEKINGNVKRIATEAYVEKFNEDKKGFVMRFMMGGVMALSKDGKEMVFDRVKFRNLISYLDGLGVDIENVDGASLYDWLAEESEEMTKYIEIEKVNITRRGIREDLGNVPIGIEVGDMKSNSKLFFDKGFDVEAFYSKFIAPAIFRFKSAKLKSNYSNPEVSLFHGVNSPEKMSQVIFSTKHLAFLKSLVDTAKSDPVEQADFMATIRILFGFNNSPMLDSLSHSEVKALIAYYMEVAEQKIERNLRDAMYYLKQSEEEEDKKVIEACKYFPEITGCRDLSKLMEWLVYKDSFKKEFPEYSDVNNKVIYHQCLMMLKDFAFVSKRVSSEEFMRVVERRNALEKYMIKALNIRNMKNVTLRYRLVEELPTGVRKVDSVRKYKVVYEGARLEGFDASLDKELAKKLMNDPDITKIEHQGVTYLVHPIEEAKFKRVKMKVENVQENSTTKLLQKVSRQIEVLIYAGRDQYIHVKDELTRLLSETRGKEVSDENRWLLVPADKRDSEFLKCFMLRDHAREIVKVDDRQSGFSMTTKKVGKVLQAASSSLLKENQSWSVAKKYSWLARKPGTSGSTLVPRDAIRYDAVLETQSQNLNDLLIYNVSDYAPSSHAVYRAQRAWKLLNIYFNPQVWGDEFRRYFKRGCKGVK